MCILAQVRMHDQGQHDDDEEEQEVEVDMADVVDVAF